MMSVQTVVPHQDLLSLITKERLYGHTYMDATEKKEFQAKRYDEVMSELKHTSLEPADRELFAQALSKLYVGVPLCKYTYSDEVKGELFDNNSLVGKWEVVPKGVQRFRSELPDIISMMKPLYSPTSPFVYMPATPFSAPFIPFSITDIKMLNKTTTRATFVFPFDHQLFADAHYRVRWLMEQTDWRIELTVDKEKQSPQMLKIRLAQPVKKRMRYSFDKVEVSMNFTYIESCEFHALTSLSLKIEGWAFSHGKVEEEKTDTYSNIECNRPLVYLHPHTTRVNFLDHISYRQD